MIKKILLSTMMTLSLSLVCLSATPQMALAAGDHLISMRDADIRAFIDDVSMVTGYTFLVDPRIQGKVTISSEQSLSSREVFDVFKNVMRVHGYAVIQTGKGQYRITLLQGASQEAPFVDNVGATGQFSTTVIRLNTVDAVDVAKLLKPVMHSQGIVTANPGGNVVVISDYPENLKKARSIIASMDQDSRVIETVELKNISPLDAQNALKELAGPRSSLNIIAMPGSDVLLLQGRGTEISRLKQVVSRMDQSAERSRGGVSVVPLRFASGTELVELLGGLLQSFQEENSSPATVAYDPGSNSILISADPEIQSTLEGIIRRVDVRRPQVLVEAIIVEISNTAANKLGVQFALGGVDGNAIPFTGTNFSNQATSMLTLAGAVSGTDAGLPEGTVTGLQTAAINSLVGLQGVTIGGAGRAGDILFAGIFNALETDKDSNILSTPFVTTIDNVPATFLAGQEIPITTGETLGTNNSNPFRTFDREKIGIKLNVLPQISEGDVIRLEIEQEVSSIAGALTATASQFVTNNREIKTSVLANDGEVIVLGGLIQDDEQINIEKIPLLGDVPVIAPLFTSKDKSRVRTNLMVFLRPTIIRNQSDAEPITQQRLNYMRQQDRDYTGRDISKIDTFFEEIAPNVTPNGTQEGTR